MLTCQHFQLWGSILLIYIYLPTYISRANSLLFLSPHLFHLWDNESFLFLAIIRVFCHFLFLMVMFLVFLRINLFEGSYNDNFFTQSSYLEYVFVDLWIIFFLWDIFMKMFQNPLSLFIVDKKCRYFRIVLETTTTYSQWLWCWWQHFSTKEF